MNISPEEQKFINDAMEHYKNPRCLGFEEFYEDFSRVKSIIRLFTKYKKSGVLNERLILNHIIVLYNMFESHATDMMFKKVPVEYYPFLKPFLILKGCMPEEVLGIESSEIGMDKLIVERLRRL